MVLHVVTPVVVLCKIYALMESVVIINGAECENSSISSKVKPV